MSMPPPPGNNPPPFDSGGFQPGQSGQFPPSGQFPQPGHAPMGYQPYGQPNTPQQQGTNGLSIASLVLSLVNIVPCFWVFPVPALLGLIFGVVARGQIKNTGARGKGLAVAGIVVGIIFLIIGVLFWIYVATSDNCVRDGSSFRCTSD